MLYPYLQNFWVSLFIFIYCVTLAFIFTRGPTSRINFLFCPFFADVNLLETRFFLLFLCTFFHELSSHLLLYLFFFSEIPNLLDRSSATIAGLSMVCITFTEFTSRKSKTFISAKSNVYPRVVLFRLGKITFKHMIKKLLRNSELIIFLMQCFYRCCSVCNSSKILNSK
jgi:hypothetical protein